MQRVLVGILASSMLLFAGTALAAKGGGGSLTGHISVPDATYGGMTTATVNPGDADTYVLVQCYAPEFGGSYVYARYFPVDPNTKQASIGPLSSTLWARGDASCRAQEGYYTRNGFGRWVVLAETTFRVSG